MHTLFALVLTAASAVVIARPPGPVVTTVSHDESSLHTPTRKYLKDYLLPRYLWPHYFTFDETPRPIQQPHRQPSMPATEWLNQEIERLSRMQQRAADSFTENMPRRMLLSPSFMKRWPSPYEIRGHVQPYFVNQPWPAWNLVSKESVLQRANEMNEINKHINVPVSELTNEEQKKRQFALTPTDEGYFEPSEIDVSSVNSTLEGLHEGGGKRAFLLEAQRLARPELEPRRQIRQNPNLSRTKTLVAENLDKLRIGLSNKEYRLPVSLLPSNLRWLKISRPIEVNQSGHENSGSMDNPRHMSVLDNAEADSTGTFYGVALLSAIGAAAVLAILGFAIGWYTLSKRAKAAADVDYPAYGVTGPTVDTSGDRKLAHSAHMYHYQHQKQQIIAMERNGMEQRSGSVSDPESEDENEEGDYTVYECPGFATTGDMEVKNPLFNEEPTPATPGKCEVVKPQPKD